MGTNSSRTSGNVNYFIPDAKIPIGQILKRFSLSDFLEEADIRAPSVCQLLRQIGFPDTVEEFKFKKRELVRFLSAPFIDVVFRSWLPHSVH